MTDKLLGVHPVLIAKIARLLDALDRLEHPMLVTDGVRTAQRQFELYSQGRTMPGKIVTYCDGELKKSNHQPAADGFGRAVDCARGPRRRRRCRPQRGARNPSGL